MVYDLSRKPGDRVVKLDVLCTQCRVPSYEPLQMDKTYKVVLPSFLANGGDGFRMIKDEALRHDSGKHKCLSLPLLRKYSRTTVLVQRGELLMMPGLQSQNQIPPRVASSSQLCWKTAAQHWGRCALPPPQHTDPPVQAQNVLKLF